MTSFNEGYTNGGINMHNILNSKNVQDIPWELHDNFCRADELLHKM